VCHEVDNEYSVSSEPNSRLLFISKYVPKILDPIVLKYNYYQSLKIVSV